MIPWKVCLKLGIDRMRGPYTNSKNKRKFVEVILDSGKTKRMLLSRLKMIIKEERWLLPSEHVDHKDEDKTNDRIANLQILTPVENLKKYHKTCPAEMVVLVCTWCGIKFKRKASIEKQIKKTNRKNIFCSHECKGLHLNA